jgi:DNA-directed RNA polymerase specialized sigma24 family protein
MKYNYALNGLSITNPEQYRKINAVLTEKNNRKKDLLDMVETVPLDYVHNVASEEMNPEEIAIANEESEVVQNAISNLANYQGYLARRGRRSPNSVSRWISESKKGKGGVRLERMIRLRYEHEWTYEQIADLFNITKCRTHEIKRTALGILHNELTTQI